MIRIAFYHRLLRATLVVLAVFAVAGTACAEKSWQTTMTGPLEFGKRIYLRTDNSSTESPNAIEANWTTFTKRADGIYANVRTRMLSWPASKWKVSVSLLDSKGTALQSAHSVLENTGFISGVPRETVGDLRFILDSPNTPVARYRLQIALVPEDTPVTVRLEQFEIIEQVPEPSAGGRLEFDKPIPVTLSVGAGDDPDVVRLTSITFRKKGENIKADLAMTLKSWPKGKWCAAVLLLDKTGRVVEYNDVVFENEGTVKGVGTIGPAAIHITLITPRVPVETFRVELTQVPEDTPITAYLDPSDGRAECKSKPACDQ